MVEIQVAYQGELRCRARHGPSGQTLSTDAPADNQGKGESFSPTDLVATAVGTCMMTIMAIAARDRDVDLTGATVTVRKEMIQKPHRRIGRLPVEIRVPTRPPEKQRRLLEHAARACPVHRSLHPDIDSPVTFHWG